MYDWDFNVVYSYLPLLFRGLLVTFYISLFSIIFGTILGLLVSFYRYSRLRFISLFCKIYIEVFLALPVLIMLIWVYYCIPLIGIKINQVTATLIVFVISLSAFVAETFRSGYESIPGGQIEAAKTFGFSRIEVYQYIVLPQAFTSVLPALLTQYLTAIKLTTLASVIGLYELLHVANDIVGMIYRPLELYSVVALLFLVIIIPLNIIIRKIESGIVKSDLS